MTNVTNSIWKGKKTHMKILDKQKELSNTTMMHRYNRYQIRYKP